MSYPIFHGVGDARLCPPPAYALADTIAAERGYDLTDEQVRAAITERGWAAYGPWGGNVLTSYGLAAFQHRTGHPF